MAWADLQMYCPCGVVFNVSWRWSSSLGPGCSQMASLAAFLGHIKNELGQTPDVLTGCWDALIFTLLEKMMSLLLHTSVLKQKASWNFVQNRAFQFYLAFKFCCVWVIIKKIKLRLAGTYLDVEKRSRQVTGRKREWLLPRRCRRLNKFWDHRSRSGPFLWFFRLFLCWRQIRNKDKSAKWQVGVYWSRKISHSHHFPVCCERQNHSQWWIMAARAAWNYCFLKLNCCWHAWNKQRY